MAPHSQNDLATMIEVSQALSGEMVLKLIDQLMRAALEHAGASRSCDLRRAVLYQRPQP